MKSPLEVTWTFPEFNGIVIASWKKSWRSKRITADMVWNEWLEGSKILRAVWMELVMTMIFEILLKQIDWLIPHLIANNLASVLVTLIAWWIVFVRGLSTIWMCTMEVATLFLMLASEATRVIIGDEEDSKVNLSSSWARNLISFYLL